jgi:transcriptional regulator with XRE-family HTH domain
MAKKFSELVSKMPPEAQAEVKRRVKETIARMALDELREARHMTQTRMAELLGTKQGNISALEKRADMYLSTLRSYVEAMGGKLELRAIFPEGAVDINMLTEIESRAK